MKIPLTESARRAIERAALLAAGKSGGNADCRHLLQALLLEESQAAEILAGCGLDPRNLTPLGLNEAAAVEQQPGGPTLDRISSPAIQEVVFEARRRAGLGEEIGTAHLLWGLTRVRSPVRSLLGQFGIDEDSLKEDFVGGESSGEPLAVDFAIELEDGDPAVQKGNESESYSTDLLRILDAAANRAREGLRVLEDFVRWRLDDAHLTELLKGCRHELAGALQTIELDDLLRARETGGDVGTAITTPAETTRPSTASVVCANFKRVQEGLRSLEEFGKVISPELGQRMEQIRYRLYTLEKAVLLTQSSRERLAECRLYLLVTESLCRQGVERVVREALAGGVNIVQLREKTMPDGELLALAKRIREWTRAAGALFIINDRPDLALLSEADGVHVGQEELSVRAARQVLGPERLVGVSTHTIEQARRAVLEGADYLGVGPVFPSQTKQFGSLAGLEYVKQVAAEITLPWFAIGGIQAENIERVTAAGAERVAVSGAICRVDDPAAAARALLRREPAASSSG